MASSEGASGGSEKVKLEAQQPTSSLPSTLLWTCQRSGYHPDRQRFQVEPRVDPVAINIALLVNDHVAEIDADPQLKEP
jgi:hypothetical protein